MDELVLLDDWHLEIAVNLRVLHFPVLGLLFYYVEMLLQKRQSRSHLQVSSLLPSLLL